MTTRSPPPAPKPEPPPRRGFARRDRLTHAREFQKVYDEKARKGAPGGGFTLHARLNGLGHCRLGLAVGRRCGPAVVRNRIKRRLREAFRLSRHAWPVGLDVIAVASPHDPLSPENYAKGMSACVEHLARVLQRRAARREHGNAGEAP